MELLLVVLLVKKKLNPLPDHLLIYAGLFDSSWTNTIMIMST